MNRTQLVSIVLFNAVVHMAFAQGSAVQAPEPSKDLIVKIFNTDFYDRNLRCYTRQFLERRGDDLVFLLQNDGSQEKGELVLTSHLSTKVRPYPPATYIPHSYFLQFPLEKGKSWKGTYDQTSGGRTRNRTRSAEVTDYVDLTLKAGTYKAFRIQAYNQWSEARSPAIEDYYYCPELSVICRYESREFDSKSEVVEVRKASRQ